jgi:decaprenylphospho-beta-D-ribofuranose 2-oxidase
MARCYNWGRYPQVDAEVLRADRYDELADLIKKTEVLIARGQGRCYGDSALQKKIYSTLSLNKFIAFDAEQGILHGEAGIVLDDVLRLIVPQGYFLPATPGTKWITLGGAVASNIHGKNHPKEGAIAQYVEELTLIIETGALITCSPSCHAELFKATIGGMGLTGIILHVKLRLKKIETSYIQQKAIRAKNLRELLHCFEQHKETTYAVAWIDGLATGDALGRSVLMLGEHAKQQDLNPKRAKQALSVHRGKSITLPLLFPSFLLNKTVMKAFNFFYFHKSPKNSTAQLIHYDPFFYPLDAIKQWNNMYGKKGFLQYQCVIPVEHSQEGLTKILSKISTSPLGAYLAVLKRLGEADTISSPLSFPMKGYTLAIDFKISRAAFALLDELDELVLHYGGRVYLTKDARMKQETFSKSYPPIKKQVGKFQSLQSQRLGISLP